MKQCVVTICFFACYISQLRGFNIALDANGTLDNLLIQIDEDVPQRMVDGKEVLIEAIKKHVTRASNYLRTATNVMKRGRGGVQLGKVLIKIPSKWNLDGAEETWHQCPNVDIFVSGRGAPWTGNKPYTQQINGCGQPGTFSKFTDEYFLRGRHSTGKEVMRELVKLRYGVFSERPLRNELFVFVEDGFVQSSCSEDVRWRVRTPNVSACLAPNDVCEYEVDPKSQHSYSVMFDTDSDQSRYFCDDEHRPHNVHAKSLHNKLCKTRSVANVILTHRDFIHQRPKIAEGRIHFEVVKSRPRKIVLVLDSSHSMKKMMHRLKAAVSKFVDEILEDDAELAIVTFGSQARILTSLLPMNSVANRRKIIGIVNSIRAQSATNVVDGLMSGIEALGGRIKDDGRLYGTMFLLSDGRDNIYKKIEYNTAIRRVIGKGVVVNCISFSLEADPQLADLADKTGGLYTFASLSTSFTDLLDIFSKRLPCEDSIFKPMKVSEGVLLARVNNTVLGTVDKYLGLNTSVRLTVKPEDDFVYKIVDPSGKEHGVSSTVVEKDETTHIYGIRGKYPAGNYSLRYNSVSRSGRNVGKSVAYAIISHPDPAQIRTIDPIPRLSQSYVELVNGSTEIKLFLDLSSSGLNSNEQVTLQTDIVGPSRDVGMVKLKDDGLLPDIIPDDHVYTASLFRASLAKVGFYRIVCRVQIVNSVSREVIKRIVDFPALRVMSVAPNAVDRINPGQVQDVSIALLGRDPMQMKISWTCTGDDGIQGNISIYKIMVQSADVQIVPVLASGKPGQRVSYMYNHSSLAKNGSAKVWVQGVDFAGNGGDWSDVVSTNINYAAILRTSHRNFHRYYKQQRTNKSNTVTICLPVVLLIVVEVLMLALT